MTVGSWNPGAAVDDAQAPIDSEVLQRFIALSDQEQLDDLQAHLSQDDIQQYAGLITREASDWQSAADTLNPQDIFRLMRFFTVAEGQLPGWEANEQSAVIHLNKILKKRGQPLQREQVLWIKANTRNRFLPNGAIL